MADTTVPSGGLPLIPGLGTSTVIAVTPLATALKTPLLTRVATPLLLALHFTPAALVRSTVPPAPVVPMAMNVPVCPTAVSVCEAGTMATDTYGSVTAGTETA